MPQALLWLLLTRSRVALALASPMGPHGCVERHANLVNTPRVVDARIVGRGIIVLVMERGKRVPLVHGQTRRLARARVNVKLFSAGTGLRVGMAMELLRLVRLLVGQDPIRRLDLRPAPPVLPVTIATRRQRAIPRRATRAPMRLVLGAHNSARIVRLGRSTTAMGIRRAASAVPGGSILGITITPTANNALT